MVYLFFHHHPSVNLSSISPRTWIFENGNCFCCCTETSLLRTAICPELAHRLTQSHWLVPPHGITQASRDPRRSLAQSPAQSRVSHEVKPSCSSLHPALSWKPPMKICKCYTNKWLHLRSQCHEYQPILPFIHFSYEVKDPVFLTSVSTTDFHLFPTPFQFRRGPN